MAYQPEPPAYNMGVAKDRAHNSAAKSLLYGGEGSDSMKHREGKKSVAHAMGGGAPFATYEAGAVPGDAQGGKAYTKQGRRTQEGAGKIGAQEFDPEVYRNNRANNMANAAALKVKNQSSGQVMGDGSAPQAAPVASPVGQPQQPQQGGFPW